jgi:ABC-type dipeptide/oligopeptide/nickel transport system ATPase component
LSENTSKKSTKKSKSATDSVSFSINRKIVFGVVGVIGAVAVGATVLAFAVPTKLESAHAQCVNENPRFADYSALDDDGKGLFLDGAGDESLGLVISDLSCAINSVGVPDSVVSRLSTTTALMGQQEATFDGITVRWSYHPNNGLDMSFEID